MRAVDKLVSFCLKDTAPSFQYDVKWFGDESPNYVDGEGIVKLTCEVNDVAPTTTTSTTTTTITMSSYVDRAKGAQGPGNPTPPPPEKGW